MTDRDLTPAEARNIPVTDADREALAKRTCKPEWGRSDGNDIYTYMIYSSAGEYVRLVDALEVAAAARAEGAASEREACEAAVDAVCRKFRAAHDPMSENAAEECYAAIRARGEQGGK